ncbi:MAG: hypothetical protein K1X95_06570 [Acidimicrobiia bacterium]|nr:hypothetical protein [Acidimicrobiia bacterium]
MSAWFRTLLEVLVVVSVGGMVVSALRMLRRGEIRVPRCPECGRPTSKAYPACKWCGTPLG